MCFWTEQSVELWEKHHWFWHNRIVSLLKQMARDTIEERTIV